MKLNRRERLEIKTPAQLEWMRRAGLVVANTLARLAQEVGAGVTTADLDAIAEQAIRAAGATPSFLGYLGFPACICVSVNDEVVHGIPGSRVLADGDVVSIDCGAIVQGWHGDAAVTVAINPTPGDSALIAATERSLWAGLSAVAVGGHVTDIGAAVEASIRAEPARYGIVEDFVGHGIGSAMHLKPDVPNYGLPGQGAELVPGLALAIEPMITRGTHLVRHLADDWTVVTDDASRAAHFEHTVAVTEAGPWVLTALDGGAARFAELGIASPAAVRG